MILKYEMSDGFYSLAVLLTSCIWFDHHIAQKLLEDISNEENQ